MTVLRHIILILALLAAAPALAQDVVVVQSFRVKPYEDALLGFRTSSGAKIRKVIIAENEKDVVRKVRRENPDVILAIGMDALTVVRPITDIPILYVMVLNPRSIVGDQQNVTGVSMNITPEKQLAALRKVLPSARRIGLLFDPQKNGQFVRRAAGVAGGLNLELVTREVRGPADIPSGLESFKDLVDALWVIPDTTVATPETIEHILLFSHKNGIPVQGLSDRFLEMGAVAAVTLDAFALGRQTGEMAQRLADGVPPSAIPRADAGATTLTINMKAARKMGISISADAKAGARLIQ